jgi:hypothetical protein
VRSQLARWSPPEFASGVQALVAASRDPQSLDEPTPAPHPAAARSSWRDIPAWAQVAAAMLIVGASAGIANLNVHYDSRDGLTVRTGWLDQGSTGSIGSRGSRGSRGSTGSSGSTGSAGAEGASVATVSDAASKADLARLEDQLRQEIRAVQAAASADSRLAALPRASAGDTEIMRRAKSLVDESERRQQSEMALRFAELVRDVNMQRQGDLRKIDQKLGFIEDRTGVAVLKNRAMIDLYMQRVSQRQ